jgi:hypothetical protein
VPSGTLVVENSREPAIAAGQIASQQSPHLTNRYRMAHSEGIGTNDAGIVGVVQRERIRGKAHLIELLAHQTPELERGLHRVSINDGSSSEFERGAFPGAVETDGAAGA